ncbi:MAG: hypothetical protein VKI82_08585 [Leptolyngbya sp.]|nr:hypothetical protein [Leptolyngbya sp.]
MHPGGDAADLGAGALRRQGCGTDPRQIPMITEVRPRHRGG